MTNRISLVEILAGFIFLVGLAQLIISIQPTAIDDTFVYYTYAKNIVEGRPFAYDIRNIPSEGFTSLLYLFLLTPFEFFKVNMPFASVIINLTAIILTLIVVTHLMIVSGILGRTYAIIVACTLWVALINDNNIVQNINLGLETMLGPMTVIWAGYAVWGTSSSNKTHRAYSLNAFFIILFLAYITRPENFFFIAIAGIPLLWNHRIQLSQIISKGFIFAIFFIGYHIIKLIIFGDILPTGFYRKVGDSALGVTYVNSWITDYAILFLPVAILIVVNIFSFVTKRQKILLNQRWLWFWAVVTLFTLLFFTRTLPLIGRNYRFLVTPTFVAYVSFICLSWLTITTIFTKFLPKISILTIAHTSLVILAIFSGIRFIGYANKGEDLLSQLHLYHKAVEATKGQTYLQFGAHLRQNIENPDDTTLVFIDAGAVPYSFGGRFIDFNGLTEPSIAHLFLQPDGKEKTEFFINYILSQSPDIILLAWGYELIDNKIWMLPINEHTPFEGNIPIELYDAYKEYGIEYVCSMNSNHYYLNYPLHFGVWIHSKQYESIKNAFLSYCSEYGFFLEDGLAISDGNRLIDFTAESK